MYAAGTGVAQSEESAFEWFGKAAAQKQPMYQGKRDSEIEDLAIKNLRIAFRGLVRNRGGSSFPSSPSSIS
jgi:TPR repeat protein